MLILNGIIVMQAASSLIGKSALYTIISIYAMTQVIDAIHTSHKSDRHDCHCETRRGDC